MIKKIVKYASISLIWLLIWQAISLLVGEELLFPSPISVILRLGEMLITAEFYHTVGVSILRVLAGMTFGILLGIIGGAVCFLIPFFRSFFEPMLAVIRSTPVASFIILIVLWLDRDIAPIVISTIMVMPVVWTGVEAGLESTDRDLLEMARLYRFTSIKKITQIYLPSAYPYFISALRSSLGSSWKAGIAAEVLLQPLVSIGKQIFESKYMLETVDLFAWTAVVIILSVLIERLMILTVRLTARKYSILTAGGAHRD